MRVDSKIYKAVVDWRYIDPIPPTFVGGDFGLLLFVGAAVGCGRPYWTRKIAMERTIERLVDGLERKELSRREVIRSLTAIAAASGAASAPVRAAPRAENTFQAVGLNHIALRVTDVPRSRDFYIRHLGMSVMSESSGSAFLRCGDEWVALFRGGSPGLDHYCYSVEGYTVTGAAEKLRAEGFQPRTVGNRIYFPDPDGLTVQLAAPNFRG